MIWFLAFIVALLPSYLVRFSVFSIPTTVLEVLIYLAVLAALLIKPIAYSYEQLKERTKPYWLPIALLLVGTGTGVFVSPDTTQALGIAKAYIVDPLLFFALLLITINTKRDYTIITNALILSGVLIAFSVILGTVNDEGRRLGIYFLDATASPNFAALYLAPIAALCTSSICFNEEQSWRFTYVLAALLMAIGLFLTGSRGALLAYIFSLGLTILLFAISKAKGIAKGITKLLLGLFVLVSLFAGWYAARPDFTENASERAATSNNLRYEIWRTTLVDIIPAKPVTGIGLGNYQNYFTQITKDRVNFPEFIAPWARTPHNIFLIFWTELGLAGLVSLAWVLCITLRLPKTNSYALSLTIAMVALLVQGLVDAQYWKNDLSVVFWSLIALQLLAHTKEVAHGTT